MPIEVIFLTFHRPDTQATFLLKAEQSSFTKDIIFSLFSELKATQKWCELLLVGIKQCYKQNKERTPLRTLFAGEVIFFDDFSHFLLNSNSKVLWLKKYTLLSYTSTIYIYYQTQGKNIEIHWLY